jgi:prephenate dehydrogenase
MINTVGIIGYGNFGTFVHELGQQLFPEIEFRIHSRRAEIDNTIFFNLRTAAQSDIVILCESIAGYKNRMIEVLKHALPETIFVDVATVKNYTSQLCHEYCNGRRFISIHPMFGAESYKKQGDKTVTPRIVVTDYALKNDSYQQLKETFSQLGFSIIEMTPDEHDKNLAETLFITHYISQSIINAGFKRTELDILPFQFLMDAVESLKYDKQLFADIYKYNSYCKEAVSKLHQAQEDFFEKLR